MTCSQCPAQNKVCAACYLHPLSNKSCGQCAGPLREYQHRLRSKSSGADIINVDAISAAHEHLLGHAAPAAATVLNSVRAEETVLLDMEQRKKTGRPPSYVLSAEDLAVLNTPGKTLADMVGTPRAQIPDYHRTDNPVAADEARPQCRKDRPQAARDHLVHTVGSAEP